ncbi:MAG: c-type cytochrome [Myxococcota bacterium]
MHSVNRSRLRAVVLAVSFCACASVPDALPDEVASHLGASWYPHRAAQLGIDVDTARARDAELSESVPPHDLWDAALRDEARAVWRDQCARCHGARGRLEGVAPLPPDQKPPRDWSGFGAKFGLFLAGDDLRATYFRRIQRGGDREGNPTMMPAWADSLSREQTWALVFLLEEF